MSGRGGQGAQGRGRRLLQEWADGLGLSEDGFHGWTERVASDVKCVQISFPLLALLV